jgi:hypothetical protein
MDDDARPGRSGRLGVSLLFPAGARPTVEALVQLLEASEMSGVAAQVSFRPDDGEGWLEILASGLTFDVRGLAPAAPAAAPEVIDTYGFSGDEADERFEAIEIVPGGHIAAGGGLAPVVRTLAGLAANLALNLPVAQVAWHSAGTCMEPKFFSRTVLTWLSGGAFPALGLTALFASSDGGVASRGLAALIGQEMQLAGKADEPPAETVKLAIRVVDFLVRKGPLAAPEAIGGPGFSLLAEPSRYGNLVWVWRKE